MRKLQLVVYFIFITQIAIAQFGSPQLIDIVTNNINKTHTADIDNDGDEDIVVVGTNLIAWYENLDGQGNFGSSTTIQEGMGQVFYPNSTLAHLNNDDDIDVVVSYFDNDLVVWYENNGNGNFSAMQTIAVGLNRPSGVVASDIDQDGDQDLVLGVSNGNGLYWVENLDGQGNFGPLNVIDVGIPQARMQVVKDIDGDGDVDILTNTVGDSILLWFENTDGQGNFSTEHIVETNGLYESILFLEDLDGDGNLDILSFIGDTVVWRKNLDGMGNFGAKQVINTVINGGFTPSGPADIDNDDDLDIVVGSLDIFRVGWHENLDGLGNFNFSIVDSSIAPPSTISASDLDNDGDLDLLVSTFINGGEKTLIWYENYTILGLDDLDIQYTVLYPNPATTILAIENTTYIKEVYFYNILGQKLLTVTDNFEQIDVSSLPNGLLLVTIETELGIITKKIIKE